MAMGGEETAAVLPKPRPETLAVGLRNLELGNLLTREKGEPAFRMGRRQRLQFDAYFKQKHQPMGLALVAMLADEPGQVQVGGREHQANFLVGLAAGAMIRGFAKVHFELAAARTPKAAIRFLRALQQQHFLALIEAIEQRGNFVGQRHGSKGQKLDANYTNFHKFVEAQENTNADEFKSKTFGETLPPLHILFIL